MELLKRQQQANSIQWECNGYILSFDHSSRHKDTRQSSATIATGGVSAATAKAAILSIIIPEKLLIRGGARPSKLRLRYFKISWATPSLSDKISRVLRPKDHNFDAKTIVVSSYGIN